MPAMAVALLAVLGAAALVIDRLALDAAKLELRTAAESAALAGARELANDDRLRCDFDPAALQRKARFAAARIAAANVVAGEPLTLNVDDGGDVRLGRLTTDPTTGETVFVEAQEGDDPSTVVVQTRRTSERDAPVPLPFRALYAPTDSDVVAIAEASVDFHVLGLRPVDQAPLPTLPLAILSRPIDERNRATIGTTARGTSSGLAKTPNPSIAASWIRDIEERLGMDRFGYDAESGQIVQVSDGLPELTLRTASFSRHQATNAYVLAVSDDLSEDRLSRQIREGWSATDLEPLGGELRLDGPSLVLPGLRGVDSNVVVSALRPILGQARIAFVYESADGDARSPVAALRITGLIAIRVMSVQALSECECEIVVQPSVLATRSAIVADERTDTPAKPNKYVANLRLTN